MRNRVSFSYIDKYNDSYSTYSNTIFFAYEEKYPQIYKGGIKYTYIGGENLTYIHHDLGTSYINVNDEKAVLYENEYDRYKYVIGEVENNKKDTSYILYNNIQTEESIYTYINVPKNSYTYFPNVITGLTGKKYDIYKYAYAYSTNGMLAYGFTYDATDSSYGKHIAIASNDYDITYDIRGTYNFNNEPIRIQGIGFSVGSKDTAMYAGVEYDNILTIKVYGFNKENPNSPIHLKDIDLYDSLNVEFPGTDENAIKEITRTSESVTIKLTKKNQHIGTILAKISLDWKNNKFTLYHQFTFAGIINKIDKINEFYYNVNENTEHHMQLLEGDYITYTYISTIPERANNTIKLELDTNPASYLNSYYDGTCEKTNNSSADYWYVVNTYVNQLNIDAAEMPVTITYNSSSILKDSTNIYRFVPSDIDFTYIDDNEILHIFTNPEDNDLSERSNNINCYMNIAYKDNLSHYHHRLNRLNSNEQNSSYNLFDIKCKYVINDISENEVPLTSSEIIYNENNINQSNSYTSYHFTYNVIEPGKYIFSYISKNGIVKHEAEIGTYIYKEEINNDDEIRILTYEGSADCALCNNSTISLSDYELCDDSYEKIQISYNNVSYYIDIPKFYFKANNNEWTSTYSYIDIYNKNTAQANIGFTYLGTNPLTVHEIMDIMTGHQSTDDILLYDIDENGIIDVGDINAAINSVLASKQISPDTDKNYLYLKYKNKNNNYKYYNNRKHKINVNKILCNTHFTVSYINNNNETFILNGTDDLNNFGKNSKNNNIINFDLDISKLNLNKNEFNITISSYLGIRSLGANELKQYFIDALNNFDISYISCDYDDKIIEKPISNSYISTTLIFDRNNLNTDEIYSYNYLIKLNRKGNDNYSSDYWDAMGFKDAIINYKINISKTIENINEITLPDEIILFTNVNNNNAEHSKSYKYKTSDIQITNLQDIEKITITLNGDTNLTLDTSNDNYTIKNGEETILTINHIVKNNKQYLEFTPLNDADDIMIKLKAKIKDTNIEKSFTVRLIKLSMEMSVNELHYIKDINNPDKILYEELLLSAQHAQDSEFDTYQNTRKDNTWIKKFCNELVDESNLLEGYEFDDNCNNVTFKIISDGESVDTNVPDGIKLLFVKNNIEYYKDERVLLPTSDKTVYYVLINENNEDEFKYKQNFVITMTESSINNTAKLFTNGKKEYYTNS